MDRKLLILLCYVIALSLAADEHRSKKSSATSNPAVKSAKPDESRGKRNLEYHISHHYTPIGLNYRADRRIATGPSSYRYTPFFPSGPPKHYVQFRRGRPGPHSLPPPYAVQMEPLVHYSQRDPLYEKHPFIPDTHNDLVKNDDLLTDNNHISENVYSGPQYSAPSPSHQYGAPVQQHHPHTVYLKEPEPIIEIIIKESNETLPAPPQQILPATKPKKEPVQVFYVKYKKNPNGSGKDSIIYDAPIPAIAPPVQDDHEEPIEHRAPVETVTYAPPPTTTLRAIIRPESEQYHAHDGIHVTFDQDKPLPSEDGHPHEESAPPPALAFPGQAPPPSQYHNRGPPASSSHQQHSFNSGPGPHGPNNFNAPQQFNQHSNFNQQRQFHSQPQSFQSGNYFQQRGAPSHARFNGPPASNPQAHFSQQQSLPIRPAQNFNSQPFPQHAAPSQFNQPLQSQHRPTFTNPPSPPRSNFGPPPPSFNSRPATHFPISQSQQHSNFNQPPPSQQNHFQSPPPPAQSNFQQSHSQQQNHFQASPPPQQFNQQQNNRGQFNNYESFPPNHNSFQQQQNQAQFQNQQFQQSSQANQQQNLQQQQNFQQQQQQQNFNQNQQNQNFRHQDLLPPGGELIHSVPKFEQHVSVQVPVGQLHQAHLVTPPPKPLTKDEYSRQIQEQFQPIPSPRPPQQQQFNQQQQQLNQQHQQHQTSQQQQQQQITQHQQQQQQINQQQLLNQQQQQQQLKQQQLSQQQVQTYNQQQVQIQQVQDQSANFFSNNLPQKQDVQKNFFSQTQQNAPETNFNSPLSQTSPRTNSIFQQTFPTSTHKNAIYRTTSKPSYLEFTKPTTTTPRSTPTITTTESPAQVAAKAKKTKETIAQLPDEVPEDLRQQLLSSGILSNADISILDYDKVGDIPIEALPPDQLANFYGAGGAQQIAGAGSAPIPSIVKPNGQSVDLVNQEDQDQEGEGSELDEVRIPYTARLESSPSPSDGQAVEMKVVRFDPETQQGQDVQDSYVRDDATQVDPVVLNDQTYNRYLPLKVSGAQFPIPDVPELKGRNVTSVVVLAPVDYNFVSSTRTSREAPQTESNLKNVRFYAGQALKELVRKPSTDNFKKWLESENKTSTDKQSVVLLVTGSANDTDKEIFMYDVTTQTVSRLSGELSSAFVDAAEANVSEEDIESLASPPKKYTKQQDAKTKNVNSTKRDEEEADTAASNRVETRVPFREEHRTEDEPSDLETGASDLVESKIPIIDPMEGDMVAEGSEALESFVDISAKPHGDLTVSETSGERNVNDKILIESGYSRTG